MIKSMNTLTTNRGTLHKSLSRILVTMTEKALIEMMTAGTAIVTNGTNGANGTSSGDLMMSHQSSSVSFLSSGISTSSSSP